MSSNNQDSLDQAEMLRKRMEENHLIVENKHNEPIDVSKLPPRSEVHRQKDEKKPKKKVRFPIVRFLALIFIIIVCLIPVYHLYWQNDVEETQTQSLENSNVDIVEMKNNEPAVPEVKDEYEFADPIEEKTTDDSKPEPMTEVKITENDAQSKVDDVIVAPSVDASSGQQSAPVQAVEDSFLIHVVKPNETLYRISMKYFKSRSGEAILISANRLDANGTIFAGQRLKIPIKQSK